MYIYRTLDSTERIFILYVLHVLSYPLTGISRAHSSPPSLQLSCMATLVVTLIIIFGLLRVLARIHWERTEARGESGKHRGEYSGIQFTIRGVVTYHLYTTNDFNERCFCPHRNHLSFLSKCSHNLRLWSYIYLKRAHKHNATGKKLYIPSRCRQQSFFTAS